MKFVVATGLVLGSLVSVGAHAKAEKDICLENAKRAAVAMEQINGKRIKKMKVVKAEKAEASSLMYEVSDEKDPEAVFYTIDMGQGRGEGDCHVSSLEYNPEP